MYNIEFDKKAADFFRKLDEPLQKRIGKKIELLKNSPHSGIPLVGNFSGFYKLRIGDYRVIYKIKNEQLTILILDIGHRKNVYD
jgi:mRNA interferase RelE/StbE